jgi:acetyl-CoA C-acetyltransferase
MNLAAKFILNICKENNISEIIYDLYSCFPAAVEMFGEALKIKNISQSSITGGMSFAGGPLNSYVLNSTVQMIRKIRCEENKCGIITGISGMMTKQSFALWGKRNLINYSFKDVSEEAENYEVPYKISSETSGEGNIIGYTIIKNEESAKKAVIYIEDVNKNRNIITSENKEIIESMEINEWVGKWIKFKNLLLIV